jgi:hypothetical protein
MTRYCGKHFLIAIIFRRVHEEIRAGSNRSSDRPFASTVISLHCCSVVGTVTVPPEIDMKLIRKGSL